MAKQRPLHYSTQTVSTQDLKYIQRPPVLNSSSSRDNFHLEGEAEAADTEQKKLVAKLIEYLETK